MTAELAKACVILPGWPCDFAVPQAAVLRIVDRRDWVGSDPLDPRAFGVNVDTDRVPQRVLVLDVEVDGEHLALCGPGQLRFVDGDRHEVLPLRRGHWGATPFCGLVLEDERPSALLLDVLALPGWWGVESRTS